MKQATDQDLQLGKWIGGAALGALVMYMLDPDRGAPRRAVSGERLRRLGRQTGEALDKVMQGGTRAAQSVRGDMSNSGRYQTGAVRSDQVSGWSDSAASPRQGGLGAMLRQGADSLQRMLGSGSSARADSRYDSRQAMDSDYGSALSPGYRADSGSGHQSERHPDIDDASTGKSSARSMRGTTLAGASVLGLAGLMAPRSPIGMAMGLAGLVLLVRATGKRPLQGMLTSQAGAQAIEVEKTIRIDAAPEKVFDMFANYENFPRYMANVLEVRDLGDRRSHWVVKGPAGSHFAWNAVLTEHSRPRRLAWESEPGAEVQQSGSIQLEPIHSGTLVTVRMSYKPPAGAVGHAVASLFGRDPKRQMDEDLERMKSLVERGAMAQSGSKHGVQESKFLH